MSDSKLNSLFSSLETQANQLNLVAESANQALETTENRLVKLNVGIELWHSQPIDLSGSTNLNDTSTEILTLFGFAKIGGKWCLAMKKVRQESGFYEGDIGCPYTNKYIEMAPVTLLSQSRNLRLNALNMLPEFLESLSENLNDLLQELSSTSSKLEVA